MSQQEAQENGNGGTPESAVEFTLNSEPQTEDQYRDYFKWLRTREQGSIIDSRWALGDRINRSNATVYGDDTIGKIAAEAGFSPSTITKCKRFAEKYTTSQKASLLNGSFSLPWRDIAQNLTIVPVDLIRAYNESSNQDEFRNAVTKLKPTRKQLETENTELRNRLSDLETENAALQQRIKELEGQHETSEALPDSVEGSELAEEM